MRVVLVALLLLAAAMAGCATKKGNDGDDDPSGTGTSTNSGSGSKGGTRSGSGTGSSAGTGTGSSTPNNATLAADVVNGTAPLAVNFTMTATTGATSWRLAFGDGSFTNGTGDPAAANHTYSVGGNFSANLTVVYSDGPNAGPNATASLNITVAVPAGGAAPDVTHFEFGESAGCVGDAHSINNDVPLNCVSFQGGPDASGIDGHWQALDERYWGMTITTTMDEPSGLNADSDCYFFAEDAETETGEASNGGDLCAGVVPDGTYWMFLYPWGFPATAMTADFSTA